MLFVLLYISTTATLPAKKGKSSPTNVYFILSTVDLLSVEVSV